jgi:renalase
MARIAIIGAGISGLSAAKLLSKHEVVIFEKSWRPGGRVTTRHHHQNAFDHGAQFFTVRTQLFSEFIAPMIHAKVIQPWLARFVELEQNQVVLTRQWSEEFPHYVGVPTMTHVGQFLAEGLNIHYETKIESLQKETKGWQLIDQHGEKYQQFDWVILALPALQAQVLVQQHMSGWSNLSDIKMQGCYSYMLAFEEDFDLGFDAALVKQKDISWISVNRSKPGRDGQVTLLVHSTNKWADSHMALDLDEVKSYLRKELESVVGIPSPILEDVHRWRFANHRKQPMQTFVDGNQQLAVCGDWCHQGRIEAAFLSAKNTIEAMGV